LVNNKHISISSSFNRLLFLGGFGSLSRLWPSSAGGRFAFDQAAFTVFLGQDAILEVDQSLDWDVFAVFVILKDSLNGLLHFCGWHAFVLLGGSLWHVKIELNNVLKLVSGVQIIKTLCNSRVLRSWPLETNSGLRSLRVLLLSELFGRMEDDPIVLVFIPLGDLLILFVFLWRHEVFDDHIFELQLVGKLVNGIEHIISLTIKIFLASIEFDELVIVLLPDGFKLLGLKVQFFLNAVKSMLLFLEF